MNDQNDKTGLYVSVEYDNKAFQIAGSIGYSKVLRDFCIWLRFGFCGVYIGYQSKHAYDYADFLNELKGPSEPTNDAPVMWKSKYPRL
jgi:hypothetical protein